MSLCRENTIGTQRHTALRIHVGPLSSTQTLTTHGGVTRCFQWETYSVYGTYGHQYLPHWTSNLEEAPFATVSPPLNVMPPNTPLHTLKPSLPFCVYWSHYDICLLPPFIMQSVSVSNFPLERYSSQTECLPSWAQLSEDLQWIDPVNGPSVITKSAAKSSCKNVQSVFTEY